MQNKPTKCTFHEKNIQIFLRLHEDCSICRYDIARSTCISASSLLGRKECSVMYTESDDGLINLLTPNVNYSGRTAPLTSKVAFYIFIQQI